MTFVKDNSIGSIEFILCGILYVCYDVVYEAGDDDAVDEVGDDVDVNQAGEHVAS